MSGHTVDTAYDGASGLDRARTVAPDVVVCDLGLPTLSGLQVARAIRRDPTLMDVKLIALTAHDRAPEAIAAGFDNYVQKPPDLKKLALLIAG